MTTISHAVYQCPKCKQELLETVISKSKRDYRCPNCSKSKISDFKISGVRVIDSRLRTMQYLNSETWVLLMESGRLDREATAHMIISGLFVTFAFTMLILSNWPNAN